MARHQTPRTLNDNLRLGRLTLPQWVAVLVGSLSLWLWGSVASPVREPNAHILLTTVPTILTVAPILAFFRGGIERYPQQLARYALRRGLVYTRRGLALAQVYALKGITYAVLTVQEWHTRRRLG